MSYVRSASARWLTAAAAFFVAGGIGFEVIRLPQEPYLGMSERGVRVALLRPDGPAARAGLQPGDRLVAIAGRPTDELANPSDYLRARSPGMPTAVIVERDGALHELSLTPQRLPPAEVAWSLGHAAVALVFVFCGVLVFLQQRRALTAVFLALCLSLAILLFKPYLPPTDLGYRWSALRLSLLSALLPALLLHFFLLFPFPRRWIEEHPWWSAALYAPAFCLVMLLEAARWPPGLLESTAGWPIVGGWTPTDWVRTGEDLVALEWSVALVLAVALFFHAYRRNRLATVRHRLRIAWIGTLASLLPLLVVIGVRLFLPRAELPGDRVATLTLAFLPVSFAYAILRQQFVDWEWLTKRALVYGALVHLAILLFFVSVFSLRAWRPELPHVGSRVGALFGVVLLAGMLGPLAHRLHDRLDRYVYPDRYDIRRPLRDLARQMRRANSESRRERVLLATLGRVLGAQSAAFFRRAPSGAFEATSFLGPRPGTWPVLSAALAEPVFAQGEPVLRGDLETTLASRQLPESDHDVLRALRARIFVPLRGRRERLGMIVLGRRSFGEHYTTPELEFLEAFQTQASLALENAELLEATRSHEGLRQEMANAQTVQQDLLPRSLPRLSHVQLAAVSQPSRDVGGDYYDCWWRPGGGARSNGDGPNHGTAGPSPDYATDYATEGGDLILAIGDVSGKGVPAALLMSNVQAIFHAEAEVGRSPAEILRALNLRLCSLDRPARFVSFFCARFDPASRLLEYANAGHLPPVWIRADGTAGTLDSGGLLLGVRAESEYVDAHVELAPGDVLVLFTDGVTERGGPHGGFDEAQLGLFVRAHRHLAADDLLAHILGRLDGRLDGPLDGPLDSGSSRGERNSGASRIEPAHRGADNGRASGHSNGEGTSASPVATSEPGAGGPGPADLLDDTTMVILKLL